MRSYTLRILAADPETGALDPGFMPESNCYPGVRGPSVPTPRTSPSAGLPPHGHATPHGVVDTSLSGAPQPEQKGEE